jgi:hypothetical protein
MGKFTTKVWGMEEECVHAHACAQSLIHCHEMHESQTQYAKVK